MDQVVLQFFKDNWWWIGPLVVPLTGTGGWLINRRVSRGSRRIDEIGKTVSAIDTVLESVQGELKELRVRFGLRGQAIREATPDQGKAVFQREQELLEEWALGRTGGNGKSTRDRR